MKSTLKVFIKKLMPIMFIMSFVLTLSAQFAGGEGTEANPWQVETAEHLNQVRNHLDAHFIQIADINLNTEPWNEGAGWVPIGSADNRFTGCYDGDGFIITGLYMNITQIGTENYGLFAATNGAVLKNIGLTNVDITAPKTVGSLAGRAENETLVTHCYAQGTVRALDTAWSIVGVLTGNVENDAVMEYCYSWGIATSPGNLTGGLSGGLHNRGIIRNCYSAAAAYGGHEGAGGITGRNHNGSQMINCYSTGVVTADRNLTGLSGWPDGGSVTNSYWNVETSGVTEDPGAQGLTTEQMLNQESFNQWDFEDIWTMEEGTYPYLRWQGHYIGINILPPFNLIATPDVDEQIVTLTWEINSEPDYYNIYRNDIVVANVDHPANEWTDNNMELSVLYTYWVTAVFEEGEDIVETAPSNDVVSVIVAPFEGGSGTVEDPYQVGTANQLNSIRFLLDSHFIQVADIDLGVEPWNEDAGWTSIGSNEQDNVFTGSYDGNGFAIFNLFMNNTNNYQGLFGFTVGATLSNIHLENISVAADNYVGSLAGFVMHSRVENCSATGNVTGTGGPVGGLIGQYIGQAQNPDSIVLKCSAEVDIEGSQQSGGLIGFTSDLTITECLATGDVSANLQVGGLIGYSSFTSINQSYTTGNVSATSTFSGGLVAYSGQTDIVNSYATGCIIGDMFVGGLVGYNGGTVSNCYSIGRVQGRESYGGLIGDIFAQGQTENSYWDIELSEQDESAGGEGRNTEQMTYPYDFTDTFVRWDFEEIWTEDRFQINGGYPMLHYQDFEWIDSPAVTIELTQNNEVILTWEAIEEANSYQVYASNNPFFEEWEQITVTADTQYSEPLDNIERKFYRVVSSSAEIP